MPRQGNPQATQAGHRIALSDQLILVAQAVIELFQSLTLGLIQPFVENFTEERDAIVRASGHRQETALRPEKGAGSREVGRRRVLTIQKITEQVGQRQVMPPTAAAGSVATGAGLQSVSTSIQRIERFLQ